MMTDAKTLSGMGRDALLGRLIEVEEHNATLEVERDAAVALASASNENLTHVQRRCTELLSTDRLARFIEKHPKSIEPLLDLAWALDRARGLHPEGASELALLEECGEVARAHRRETPDRVREELLDVAVVAMRLYLGERVVE